MRNPDRIPVFCEKLCELWKKVPDWRFGQLMVNLFDTVKKDPFFIEDKELMEHFEKVFAEWTGEEND